MSGSELIKEFSKVDTSDFPDFYGYDKPLQRGLWVLWVAKEKLGIIKLTAVEIASIITDVKRISIDAKSITNSFNRAGDKIHTYQENGKVYFAIMKPGEEFLTSQVKEGAVEVFYFEPGKKYTSKRSLTTNILTSLTGELRIVDPYCSERTLDCLKDIKGRPVKLLTKVGNLQQKARERFLREFHDFKSENPDTELRDYPNIDLHDRYIISPSSLIILGYSIKDLGGKESFAIVLNEEISRNLIEALSESFDRRWKQSTPLSS